MEPGNSSVILETYNAVVMITMVAKDEIDDVKYQGAYDVIRDKLLNTELSRGYSNWMTQARSSIEKKDFRSTVY